MFPRLIMAMDYKQKEFVAHPNTQQVFMLIVTIVLIHLTCHRKKICFSKMSESFDAKILKFVCD